MRTPSVVVAAVTSAAASSLATAGVITSPVNASVQFSGSGGSVSYAAAINKQGGIGDIGTFMGQFGTNVAVRGRWTAQAVGGEGSGANGGNVYAINVQIGSIIKIGPFAQTYTQPVILPTDTIGGAAITSASLGFGVGGGGLRFDDFGGQNQILVDNSGTFGDANFIMRMDPNFEQYVTGNPSLMSTYATVAADGSVGFATSFDVSQLFIGITDVSSFFNGNLAEYQIRGFNSAFFVEVVQIPAPGGIALLAIAGMARRRRRG